MADSLVKDAALGFRVWHGAPSRMPKSHVHGDVECNFVVQGRTHYFLGGRFVDVLPGRLSIFWGGTPHRLIRSEQGTTLFWMTLPLTWFMRCRLPAHVMQQLLAGRMLSDASPPLALLDTLMLQRWAQDFSPRSTTRESALLEIEARLQRLSGGAQRTSAPLADAGHVEILAAFMG
ncbi:MAG TPA: AraC family ligand binding domain-containing protein, partial [Tepidisphaeraceae bacterium]